MKPTFKEFQSSRERMTWHKCAKLLKIDEEYTNAPRAVVYMNSVYIEDFILTSFKHNDERGRYVLVVDRNVYYEDDLSTLEAILYVHMMQHEGGF